MYCEAGYLQASTHNAGPTAGLSYRSTSTYVPEVRPVYSGDSSSIYFRRPLSSLPPSTYTSQYSLRGVSSEFPSTLYSVPKSKPILKSSDSYPVVSPQLEDRLLQLADRSRRLGVHRFSRTRQSLVLNNQPTETHYIPSGQLPPQPPTSSLKLPLSASSSSYSRSYRE